MSRTNNSTKAVTAAATSGASKPKRSAQASTTHAARPGAAAGGSSAQAATAAAAAAPGAATHTVLIDGDDGGMEMLGVARDLFLAYDRRHMYKNVDQGQQEVTATSSGGLESKLPAAVTLRLGDDGVWYFSGQTSTPVPWSVFYKHVLSLLDVNANPSAIAACRYRLQVLEEKYNLYRILNGDKEASTSAAGANAPGSGGLTGGPSSTDVRSAAMGGPAIGGGGTVGKSAGIFADVARVDNSVRLQAGLNAVQLVGFIRDSLLIRGEAAVDDVIKRGSEGGGGSEPTAAAASAGVAVGPPPGDALIAAAAGADATGSQQPTISLRQLFLALDIISPAQITVDGLGLHPPAEKRFSRFDVLDPEVNMGGKRSASILQVFLTRTGANEGALLADAIRPLVGGGIGKHAMPGGMSSTVPTQGGGGGGGAFSGMASITHPGTDVVGSTYQLHTQAPASSAFALQQQGGGVAAMPLPSSAAAAGANDFTEYSVPIYGESDDEWQQLARWMHHQRLMQSSSAVGTSAVRNSWIIEIPRSATKRQEMRFESQRNHFDNLFVPLFRATLNPKEPSYSELANFMLHIGGFCITSDEDARPGDFSEKARRPSEVPWSETPSDLWFAYYFWANLCSLNAFRRRHGLNTFVLRASAGERTTQLDSLVYSYLLCDQIAQGVLLDDHPVLQYLYILSQIGVAMSPIANNGTDLQYMSNPFPKFFRCGLRVSLCTDSPLHYHHHDQPLLEEYATALKMYRLSPVDVVEIARNSVVSSTFALERKGAWLGMSEEDLLNFRHQLAQYATATPFLDPTAFHHQPPIVAAAAAAGGTGPTSAAEKMLSTGLVSSLAIILPSALPPPHQQQLRLQSLTKPPALGGGVVPAMRLEMRDSTIAAEKVLVFSRSRLAEIIAAKEAMGASTTTFMASVTSTSNLSTAAAPSNMDHAASAAQLIAGGASPFSAGLIPAHHHHHLGGGAPILDSKVIFSRVWISGIPERTTQRTTTAAHIVKALEVRNQMVQLPSKLMLGGGGGGAMGIDNPFARGGGGAHLGATQVAGGGAAGSPGARPQEEWKYKNVEGVIVAHEAHEIPRLPPHIVPIDRFIQAVHDVRVSVVDNPAVKAFAFRRLQLLEHRFRLHQAVNHSLEASGTNRDFYQSCKIDTNVHMETGMTARRLLSFIINKALHNGDDIANEQEAMQPQTLRQLLAQENIDATRLTVDDLNVQIDADSYNGAHEKKWLPNVRNHLLQLLVKTGNAMKGRYFAELTKLTFEDFKRDKFTFAENRLTIYGQSETEWEDLASWFDTHGMASVHNRWVIEFPRIYSWLNVERRVPSFAQYLEYLFHPLWKVSLEPSSNPRLFHFLTHISGFDCVGNEFEADEPLNRHSPMPQDWTGSRNPSYNYYLYYLWANIRSLNDFRASRGYSTFSFRPACGEAGSVDHLIGGFLLANAISFGVVLKNEPALQYLFYLAQIGISVSPLSNNGRVVNYLDNPFPTFFKRGLDVSLSTDAPLAFHHTQEPLIEEYSIASKIWKLSPTDMCEIARNSVRQSGFEHAFKVAKIGKNYILSSHQGNEDNLTHLCHIRVAYRYEAYHAEISLIEQLAGHTGIPRAMTTPAEEEKFLSTQTGAKETTKGGIIAASTDEGDLKVLRSKKLALSDELKELQRQLDDLKQKNRLLFESLQEAKARERDTMNQRANQNRTLGAAAAALGGGGMRSAVENSQYSAASSRRPSEHGIIRMASISGRKRDSLASSLAEGLGAMHLNLDSRRPSLFADGDEPEPFATSATSTNHHMSASQQAYPIGSGVPPSPGAALMGSSSAAAQPAAAALRDPRRLLAANENVFAAAARTAGDVSNPPAAQTPNVAARRARRGEDHESGGGSVRFASVAAATAATTAPPIDDLSLITSRIVMGGGGGPSPGAGASPAGGAVRRPQAVYPSPPSAAGGESPAVPPRRRRPV